MHERWHSDVGHRREMLARFLSFWKQIRAPRWIVIRSQVARMCPIKYLCNAVSHAPRGFGYFARNRVQNGQHISHSNVGNRYVANLRECMLLKAGSPLLPRAVAAPGIFMRRDVVKGTCAKCLAASFNALTLNLDAAFLL